MNLKIEAKKSLRVLDCGRLCARGSSHYPYGLSAAAYLDGDPNEPLLIGRPRASQSESFSFELSAQLPLLGFILPSAFHKHSCAIQFLPDT
jgi:hypothetical protein